MIVRDIGAALSRLGCTGWWFLLAFIVVCWGYLAYGAHAVWPGKCTGLNLNIENGDIRAVTVGGDVLAITAAFPEQKKTRVLVYDYCKGVVVSSIEASN